MTLASGVSFAHLPVFTASLTPCGILQSRRKTGHLQKLCVISYWAIYILETFVSITLLCDGISETCQFTCRSSTSISPSVFCRSSVAPASTSSETIANSSLQTASASAESPSYETTDRLMLCISLYNCYRTVRQEKRGIAIYS